MSKVIGISGSLRSGSFNTRLLQACRDIAPSAMEFEIVSLNEIPLYNADVQETGIPAPVREFHAAILGADGALIATPEYNRSMSGVLKNAIDWVSRMDPQPFANLPVAVTGASPGALGTICANYHLRQVLSVLNARLLTGMECLLAGAADKLGEDGTLTDEQTEKRFAKLLERLQSEIDRS